MSNYFTSLLDIIHSYGGDVLKFVGDALMVLFPIDHFSTQDNKTQDQVGLLASIQCALKACSLEYTPSNYLINEEILKTLTMTNRVAIGFGDMYGLHVGTSRRTEFLIMGEPIQQITLAIKCAFTKSLVVSSVVWDLIGPFCTGTKLNNSCFQVHCVNQPITNYFPQNVSLKLNSSNSNLLLSYVPESVCKTFTSGLATSIKGYLAEIRTVTVLFFNLPDIQANEISHANTLQNATEIVLEGLYQFNGSLRQVIIDDKVKKTFFFV